MGDTRRKRGSSSQFSGPLLAGKIIGDALRKKNQGDPSDYNVVVKELCVRDIDSIQLQRWLNGLRCCISSMGNDCGKLVGATLKLSWAYRDDASVAAYTEYLHDLVAAHAEHLSPCVYMLLNLFVYAEERLEEVNQLAFERAMTCLCNLLNIVPVGIHCVKQHLLAVCPYKGRSAVSQEHFVRNSLRMVDFFPELMEDVFEILMEHIVKLDVDVSKEELEAEAAKPDQSACTVFQLELEQGEESNAASSASAAMTNVPAHKLDVCMTHLLAFIRKHCDQGDGENAATFVFQVLCRVFQKVLLMTHGTSHVQFVLFYICSLNQSFVEGFLYLLWSKAEDLSCDAVTRQACVSYISSFVGRAKYIPLCTVTKCLDLMGDWVLQYIQMYDSSARSIPDANAHPVFFSIVQAMLYIFVYRHHELLRMENSRSYLQRLNFERMVTCRLNPLKVCLSNIVEVFAAITSKHELVFCYTIIQRNRRIVMPATTVSDRFDKVIHLGSFFPFDPYLLKQSAPFFEDLYTEWKDIATWLPAESADSAAAESAPMAFPPSPTIDNQMVALNLTPLSPMMCSVSPGFDKNNYF